MGHELTVELTYEGRRIDSDMEFEIERDPGLNGANGQLSEYNRLRFLPVLLPEIKQEFTTTAEELFSMQLNGGVVTFDVSATMLRKRLPKALAKLDKSSSTHKERVQSIKDFVGLAAKWEQEGKQVRIEIRP